MKRGGLTIMPLITTSKSCGDFPLPGHFFEPKITSTPRNINMVDQFEEISFYEICMKNTTSNLPLTRSNTGSTLSRWRTSSVKDCYFQIIYNNRRYLTFLWVIQLLFQVSECLISLCKPMYYQRLQYVCIEEEH